MKAKATRKKSYITVTLSSFSVSGLTYNHSSSSFSRSRQGNNRLLNSIPANRTKERQNWKFLSFPKFKTLVTANLVDMKHEKA